MKRKILLFLAFVSIVACFFAISISAETPSMYIEFGARFPGSDEYVTVYTQNAETSGNPQINFASYKFYSDVDFTTEVDISTVTGLDFSVAVSHNSKSPVNRMKAPSTPFVNCTEIKWFTQDKAMDNAVPGKLFIGWSGLKYFDFGNAKSIGDNSFQGCGFESITLPATITSIGGSVFRECTSLKSVKFEGNITKTGNGGTFYRCPALTTVDFGNQTVIANSMFKESGITSIVIPAGITTIGSEAFANCKSLTSVVFEEGFAGTLGSSAFMGASALTTLTLVEGITAIPSQCFWSAGTTNGIEKVVLPDSVTTLAGRAFNSSGIKVLEIRETSKLASITGDAFASMKQLTSIYLPTGVVISCNNLFQYCHKLERVDNFENVKLNISSYGENVFVGTIFYECMKLKEIKIPLSVTKIVGTAWRYNSLERIYIPASVTSIESGWLDNKDHLPTSAVIFYCGGDAQKLLSLTDDGAGNVSTRLAGIIEGGNTAVYSGIDAEYADGAIVAYANGCDVYYGGKHGESTEIIYTYIDENGNPKGVEFLSTLKVSSPCSRNCGSETVIKMIAPLFTCLGYSSSENGNGGIVIGFNVNNEAVKEYEKTTGKALKFGVFAVSKDKLGDNEVFTQNGALEGVLSADMTNRPFDLFEIKVVGFTDSQKDAKLVIGAYVAVTDDEGTKYSYIQDDTKGEKVGNYYAASYNDIVSLAA